MKRVCLLFIFICSCIYCMAQTPGDNDLTFNPNDIGFNFGSRCYARSILVQPDNKILVRTSSQLFRINYDGTTDSSFVSLNRVNSENNGSLNIALQPDLKVLAAMKDIDPGNSYFVIRLLPDGNPDNTFDNSKPFNNPIYELILQQDGKILVGGAFTAFDGVAVSGIVRLNIDGSRDTSFNTGSGFSYFGGLPFIYALDIDSGGNILVGGKFNEFNGQVHNNIIRLTQDGSVDSTFGSTSGFNGFVNDLRVQPDGKTVICGNFWMYNSVFISRSICRLNVDGTIDNSFNQVGVPTGGWIDMVELQSDGKIIIFGGFYIYDTTPCLGIGRLFDNGNLDLSFVSHGFNTYYFTSLALQNDGKIILGSFTNLQYGDIGRNGILRIMPNGDPDHTFFRCTGFNNTVRDIKVLPNGDIMASGEFSNYNNHSSFGLVRLHADGTADTTFRQLRKVQNFSSLAIQPDGKIIANGLIFGTNPVLNGLARFHPNGILDSTFSTPVGYNFTYINFKIDLLPDGKIIAAHINPKGAAISRFNINGSLDSTYISGAFDSYVNRALQLNNGKTIVIGSFSKYYYNNDSISAYGIIRINPDGMPDSTFILSPGPAYSYSNIALQSDGKILLSPNQTYNLLRLLPDGGLDSSFVFSFVGNSVEEILLQPDGKILVGGNIGCPGGMNCSGLVRLNADGIIDNTLQTGTGYLPLNVNVPAVKAIALTGNLQLLAGGAFTSYNGIGRNRINKILLIPTPCSNPPAATISTSGPTTFCPGDSVVLNANTGFGLSYEWKKYGNIISGATSDSYTAFTTGKYRVIVTDQDGCSSSSMVVEVVIDPFPSATITASGPTTFCSGESVTLNANTGQGYTYQWKKYGNLISNATNASLLVTSNGKYKAIVSNATGCSKTSNLIIVTVNGLPPASIVAVGATSICTGDSVELLANSGSGLTYQWKKYANLLTGETGINYYANTAGKYKCIVTNSNGCSRNSNAIVVNVVCREGEFESSLQSIEVFPNPSKNSFNVYFEYPINFKSGIVVYDLSGRVVNCNINFLNEHQTVISQLTPGIYYLKFDNQVVKLIAIE